ncbi:MAG: acyl carrier protein [Clostridia bacterium]|nr:acyl carrier protein [Clostridia bacterium]
MIFEKITEILAEQLAADQNTMTMDTKIAEDLGADSLDLVDLLMSMEDEFGIEITDEDAAELHTIGDVVNFISKNVE